MKTILLTWLLALSFIFMAPQSANAGIGAWKVNGNPVTMVPGVMVPMMTQSEFRICQIRRFFCGKTGAAIVAFAIFCAGVLVITQKLHWAPAILIIAGILTFYNARYFGQFFGRQAFQFVMIDNPMCDCACSINMDMIFSDPAGAWQQLGACVSATGNQNVGNI